MMLLGLEQQWARAHREVPKVLRKALLDDVGGCEETFGGADDADLSLAVDLHPLVCRQNHGNEPDHIGLDHVESVVESPGFLVRLG